LALTPSSVELFLPLLAFSLPLLAFSLPLLASYCLFPASFYLLKNVGGPKARLAGQRRLLASSEPPLCLGRRPFGFSDHIRVRGVVCLSTEKEGANPWIRPRMSGLTWTMTGSPCRRPSPIHVFQESDRHTRHPRALLQRFCVRKFTLPLNGVGRATFGPSQFIRLKAHIGPWILPVHRTESFNLRPTSECLLLGQPSVVFGGPQTDFFSSLPL